MPVASDCQLSDVFIYVTENNSLVMQCVSRTVFWSEACN